MPPFQNALVITGGASGIGAASVQAALGRNWLVASCDVQPRENLPQVAAVGPPALCPGRRPERRGHGGSRGRQLQFFADHNGGVVPPLGVVACAGISRRGDPEQVKLMKDINEGGTLNLLRAFADPLQQGGLFVGLSSIVAAEGIAVKGDEEYKLTKIEARRIATEEAARLNVRGFAWLRGHRHPDDPPRSDLRDAAPRRVPGVRQAGPPAPRRDHRTGRRPWRFNPGRIFAGLLGRHSPGRRSSPACRRA